MMNRSQTLDRWRRWAILSFADRSLILFRLSNTISFEIYVAGKITLGGDEEEVG
jgi:hypothetical protein